MSRLLVLVAVVVAGLAVVAPGAASADPRDQVVVSGSVVVGPRETVGDVVILDGPVTILGRVRGHVVAVSGRVRIVGGQV